MNEEFRYFLRVRDYECDDRNVVCDASYGKYAGVATTEFLRALPVPDFVEGPLQCKVVKQQIRWFAPARFDDVLEISVEVRQISRSSLTIATEFRIAGSKEVIASAETVRSVVDSATMEKRALPHRLREVLKKGVPYGIVDHAGYLPMDDYRLC